MKRLAIRLLKVISGIAGLLFLFLPGHSTSQLLALGVCAVVFFISLAVAGNLDDENTGYWPDDHST